MAKRGLCLLLAVATVLSLSAPAFAEEEPVEEPEVVTEVQEAEPVKAAATSGTCGDNVKWSLSNGTLTISGTGAIENGAFGNRIDIKTVVIEDGVTGIGHNAFEGCTALTSVTVPSSVTSLGGHVFDDTPWQKKMGDFPTVNGVLLSYQGTGGKVTIPSSVTSIAFSAFAQTDLTSVTVLNPNCVIPGPREFINRVYYALGVPGIAVIHGYAGSTAQEHAKQYGYRFETLAPAATPLPKLAAPTVKIAKVSDGIQVTWNKITGSPRYMVYYKENNSGWKKIGTTTATSYTRKAANLKNGATYQFTVRCCANDKKTLLGPYKASNSLKYTVTLAAPAVKIAKASDGIKVTWNKIDGAPRYMVYYKEGSGSWKKIGTTTATSYTRKASALKNGATYQFTVRCCANDKKTLLGPYKASNSLKYTASLTAQELFSKIPSAYRYDAPMGFWGRELKINKDGSFTGSMHDLNAGEIGPGYENGTIYEANFSGKFVDPVQINDYTYSVQLSSFKLLNKVGSSQIVDGRLHVYMNAGGTEIGKTFYIYTPDAPMSKLPKEFLSWMFDSKTQTTLGMYGLYNVNAKEGWYSGE